MPDLKSSNLLDVNETNLVNINKFKEESMLKLKTFDRINDDLIAQVSKNFQQAIFNHMPGTQISQKLIVQPQIAAKPKVDLDNFRLSEKFKPDEKGVQDVEWPDQAMKEEFKAGNKQDMESLQLVGIETQEDNKGNYGVFNFQLSNGKRAVLKNNKYKMKLFMLDLTGKSVRKVLIYHNNHLCGLKFFD
jgi:hypothetical protein